MNINWASSTIDIFNLDYPPIINIFRQPSEPFWGSKCYFYGYSETILSLYVRMRNLFLNVVYGD